MLTLNDFPEQIALLARLKELNPYSIVEMVVLEQNDSTLTVRTEIRSKHSCYSDISQLTVVQEKTDIPLVSSKDWEDTKKDRDLLKVCCDLLKVSEEQFINKLQGLLEQHSILQNEVDVLRGGEK